MTKETQTRELNGSNLETDASQAQIKHLPRHSTKTLFYCGLLGAIIGGTAGLWADKYVDNPEMYTRPQNLKFSYLAPPYNQHLGAVAYHAVMDLVDRFKEKKASNQTRG